MFLSNVCFKHLSRGCVHVKIHTSQSAMQKLPKLTEVLGNKNHLSVPILNRLSELPQAVKEEKINMIHSLELLKLPCK